MQQLAKAHLETLSTPKSSDLGPRERLSVADILLFAGVPLMVGTGLGLFDVKAPNADALLAAIAVLTGLLFALLVLMFERVVDEKKVADPDAGNDPVVDAWQVLANVSWAILVSLLLLVILFLCTLFFEGALSAWATGIVVAMFVHLTLTLLMILRRVFFMAMRVAGYRRFSELRR